MKPISRIPALLLCLSLAPQLHAQREGGDRHHGLFHHLEGAIVALRELGREDEARKLTEWARELRAGMDREQPRERQRSEREVAMEQVELMRHGAQALAKAGRKDAAESLERAATAIHVRAQGRRDAEARELSAKAPEQSVTGRHLAMAAEVLVDQGDRHHAELTARLSRQFLGQRERGERRERGEARERREGERREQRERREQGERREREERPREQRRPRQEERRDADGGMERRMEELLRNLERMHTELERLRRDVDRLQRGRR